MYMYVVKKWWNCGRRWDNKSNSNIIFHLHFFNAPELNQTHTKIISGYRYYFNAFYIYFSTCVFYYYSAPLPISFLMKHQFSLTLNRLHIRPIFTMIWKKLIKKENKKTVFRSWFINGVPTLQLRQTIFISNLQRIKETNIISNFIINHIIYRIKTHDFITNIIYFYYYVSQRNLQLTRFSFYFKIYGSTNENQIL